MPTILHSAQPDMRRQTERLRPKKCLKMKDSWVHLRMCLICGRVVFYVKDLQRSLVFYRDLLGFKEVGRVFNCAAAALTSGRTYHELLLILMRNLSPSRSPGYTSIRRYR